ncbi:MAG: PRD domain-containing protein [Rothia sp. (in: high G+C Gram-positive bacteria)]|nr:PRD domain-containing protein [Rothia sp. (in: high G+C Gram-positive bacteria)]
MYSLNGPGVEVKIVHIYNNNVVLAQDQSAQQRVVIGRGLAYQKKKGQLIDPDLIEQTFIPEASKDLTYSASLLAAIPSQLLLLAAQLEEYAQQTMGFKINHSFVLALADHLHYALERTQQGILLDYPLASEVESLYPREVEFGRYALKVIKDTYGLSLADGEASTIAMHLVNTQFSDHNLAKTFGMTQLLAQIFSIISFAYQQPLDRRHLSVARFVAHLRYLFVRVEHQEQGQKTSSHQSISRAVASCYPKASSCARKVRMLLEMHLKAELSADEQTYLTIHIARLDQDLWSHDSQDSDQQGKG